MDRYAKPPADDPSSSCGYGGGSQKWQSQSSRVGLATPTPLHVAAVPSHRTEATYVGFDVRQEVMPPDHVRIPRRQLLGQKTFPPWVEDVGRAGVRACGEQTGKRCESAVSESGVQQIHCGHPPCSLVYAPFTTVRGASSVGHGWEGRTCAQKRQTVWACSALCTTKSIGVIARGIRTFMRLLQAHDVSLGLADGVEDAVAHGSGQPRQAVAL